MKRFFLTGFVVGLLATLLPALAATPEETPASPVTDCGESVTDEDVYVDDVAFALDELEKQCGHFFKQKGIDWKKVAKEFKKSAKGIEDDAEYRRLLVRLLARLKDGHARIEASQGGEALPYPEDWKKKRVGCGMTICRVGKKFYVRTAVSSAAEVGIKAGMEVVKVNKMPVAKWFEERLGEYVDTRSCSTDQHAFFGACNWGFMQEPGTRIKLELRAGRKKKTSTITFDRFNQFNQGPAVLPEGLSGLGNSDSMRWCKLPSGHGYINIRRIKSNVLEQMDAALADLADCPGLILDFRGNTGGGCDHDAFEARFVPKGAQLQRMARSALASAGAHPYAGPMIVIVDGTVVSAGETTSGMFKEDGRAFMIGESATAGMSSSKTTIALPSGKAALYVSIRSNRSSFNRGKGIEGIGVAPQEVVDMDPELLSQGIDPLIARALELLEDYPQKEVRYDPADHGWGE